MITASGSGLVVEFDLARLPARLLPPGVEQGPGDRWPDGRRPDIEILGEAATGHDAIELIDSLEPDVVVLDLQLPDCDGIDICREITARTATRVLILTAYEINDNITAALDGMGSSRRCVGGCGPEPHAQRPVSYTHLTLPTILRV